MINQNILVRLLTPADIAVFVTSFAAHEARFAHEIPHYLAESDFGFRNVFVAFVTDEPVGIATLKWESEYAPFRYQKLAELADLWVLPAHRRHGVGLALCQFAASQAHAQGFKGLGLGVQLSGEYGPAQRFYAKNGWLPDGAGVQNAGQKTLEDNTVVLNAATVQMWVKVF
jgi:GNAT superfamily N-acetyltransferase